MKGFRFTGYIPPQKTHQSGFDRLYSVFQQLILMTSGDVAEALSWLTNLDKRHGLTDDSYGIGDFIQELKDKGYIKEEQQKGTLSLTRITSYNVCYTKLLRNSPLSVQTYRCAI